MGELVRGFIFSRPSRAGTSASLGSGLNQVHQMMPPDDDGREHDGGGEVGCELVVAGDDASPILEAAEHALDEIALAIGGLVERMMRVGLFGMTGTVPRSRKAAQTIPVASGVV
jgi:hypothetical protein